MDQIIKTVNEALEVYYKTPIEKYPQARAIDKLDELTPSNSQERYEAYKLLLKAIQSYDVV